MPAPYKYEALEERTLAFAAAVRKFAKNIPLHHYSDDLRQLLRSSGSVGANYIEANESLGRKDFVMRIRLCKKGAKESAYWLRLLALDDTHGSAYRKLRKEARELMLIFAAILRKCDKKK